MSTSPSDADPIGAQEKQQLDIKSLRKLEFCLGISRSQLRAVAIDAERYYSPFPKPPKIRPFQKKLKESKERIIDNPVGPLKQIQRRIQRNLLAGLDLPFYLCGGVKGRTLLDNVLLHLGADTIIAVDIKEFFPSVGNQRVYGIWKDLLGCSPQIAALLTRLTTRQHCLPQGASTSTTLANLALFSVDQPIRELCQEKLVRYSTWVDDLAFSGAAVRDVLPVCIETLQNAGFTISRKKIKVMGPGDRKVLNGILLNRFPNILREREAQLRSGIHKLRTNQVPVHASGDYIRSLSSSIAQVASINPRKGARLLADLDEVRKYRISE